MGNEIYYAVGGVVSCTALAMHLIWKVRRQASSHSEFALNQAFERHRHMAFDSTDVERNEKELAA